MSLEEFRPTSLLALVKYWHSHPESAAHVLDLSVHWDDINRKKKKIKGKDIAELQVIAKSLNLTLPEHWHESTENLAILTGIAILQARNVRHLSIIVDVKSEVFFKALPGPAETSIRLRELRSLRFTARHSYRRVQLHQIFPLLRLAPFITSFCGDDFVSSFEGMDWSRIKKLRFERSGLSVESLTYLIKSCVSLEEFVWWSPLYFEALQDIISALILHGDSLKVLELDGQGGTPMRLHSFAKLASLESLKIPVRALGTGSHSLLRQLPQSLKHLEIRGYTDGYEEDFVWLAAEVEGGKFPDLGTISFTEFVNGSSLVGLRSYYDGELACNWTLLDVRDMFSALGVTDPTPGRNGDYRLSELTIGRRKNATIP